MSDLPEWSLVLKAEVHNWGLMGPGDWNHVDWFVFSDRTYKKTCYCNPTIGNHDDTSPSSLNAGKISQKAFDRLLKCLDTDPWRDSEILCCGCDGVAWQIEQYDAAGTVVRTSGEPGYIYGNHVLESIVSLLPGVKAYDASVYIGSLNDSKQNRP